MAEQPTPKKTPHTTLIEALERVDEMDGVLVIFQKKPGVGNSMASVDSDLTVAETLHFLDVYKHWLLTTYIREV